MNDGDYRIREISRIKTFGSPAEWNFLRILERLNAKSNVIQSLRIA